MPNKTAPPIRKAPASPAMNEVAALSDPVVGSVGALVGAAVVGAGVVGAGVDGSGVGSAVGSGVTGVSPRPCHWAVTLSTPTAEPVAMFT